MTLYVWDVPTQGFALPVIVLGCAGTLVGVTARVLTGPTQGFEGVTVMFPEPDPTVTVIELVVPPAVCVHPDGNAQVYVTPETLFTL